MKFLVPSGASDDRMKTSRQGEERRGGRREGREERRGGRREGEGGEKGREERRGGRREGEGE